MAKKILIFSPEALVVPHFACSLVVGRTLKERGHTVQALYCHSLFQRCVSKDSVALGVGVARGDVAGSLCRQCSEHHAVMANAYGMEILDFRSFEQIGLYEKIYDQLTPHRDQLVNVRFSGIRFGLIAFHDLALNRKTPFGAALDEEAATFLQETIASAIALHVGMRRLLETHRFDMVLVNGQYAPNMAVLQTAAQLGIGGRILYNPAHMNVDRRWIEVFRMEGREVDFALLDAWPDWRRLPLEADFMAEVKRDIVVRSQGTGAHIYSPRRSVGAVDLREKLNLPADKKILVAFTSSLDEQGAEHALFLGMDRPQRPPPKEIFADQVDWLRFIADRLGDRDDVFLVIRIHPREDANKRDSRRSAHLQRLETALAQTAGNVRVVWPRDPTSSYDLMELADVVLTSWSTAGIECARLGVPVVGAFCGFHNIPVGDFISWAEDREGYLRLIDEELSEPGDFERVRLAFRWYYVMRFVGALWFGDVFSAHDQSNLPIFRNPSSGEELERELFAGEPPIYERRLAARKALCADPDVGARLEEAETRALYAELRDVVHFLLTGAPLNRPFRLVVRRADQAPADDPEPQPQNVGLLTISADGWSVYRFADHPVIRRTSTMAARLACLCENAVEEAASPAAARQ